MKEEKDNLQNEEVIKEEQQEKKVENVLEKVDEVVEKSNEEIETVENKEQLKEENIDTDKNIEVKENKKAHWRVKGFFSSLPKSRSRGMIPNAQTLGADSRSNELKLWDME